jgi:predicted amidohydrolase YtcJ
MAVLDLTVVTQPAFVAARGDRYLAEVDPDDQPHLYPCASLLAAGVEVGGSTDAPFGPDDPWVAINAAMDRRTRMGAVLGADERVPARRALELFLSAPSRPGGPPRRVEPGAYADLCLLDAPLDAVLSAPTARRVRMAVCRGVVTYDRG